MCVKEIYPVGKLFYNCLLKGISYLQLKLLARTSIGEKILDWIQHSSNMAGPTFLTKL